MAKHVVINDLNIRRVEMLSKDVREETYHILHGLKIRAKARKDIFNCDLHHPVRSASKAFNSALSDFLVYYDPHSAEPHLALVKTPDFMSYCEQMHSQLNDLAQAERVYTKQLMEIAEDCEQALKILTKFIQVVVKYADSPAA